MYPLPIFNCSAWRQPLEVHQFLRFSSQRFHLWQEFCSLGIHKISIATDILKIMLVFEKDYLPISFPRRFCLFKIMSSMFYICPYIEKTKPLGTWLIICHFQWNKLFWFKFKRMPCIKTNYFNICTKRLIYQRWKMKLKLSIQIYSNAYLFYWIARGLLTLCCLLFWLAIHAFFYKKNQFHLPEPQLS